MSTNSKAANSPDDSPGSTTETELTLYRDALSAARAEIRKLVTANNRLEKELAELARREARARYLAYRDELTGLPNRTLLVDRLGQELARTQRHSDTRLGVLFVDLDGFKQVKDQFGHAFGNALLRCVAGRLMECTRSGDTVCRYGGDEFLLVMPDIKERPALQRTSEKIRQRLSEPYLLEGQHISISACVGAVIYPTDAGDSCTLIDLADAAMYRNKQSVRGERAS